MKTRAFIYVTVASCAVMSCKSSPEVVTEDSRTSAPLTDAPELSFRCEGTDWRAARLCDSDSCVSETVREQCVACVSAVDGCAGDDCGAACKACLGESVCAYDENASQALAALTEHSTDMPQTIRIASPPVEQVLGATGDGSTVVARLPEERGAKTRGSIVVLNDDAREIWRVSGHPYDTVCYGSAVSATGTRIVRACGAQATVWDTASGFVTHRFPLDLSLVDTESRWSEQAQRTNPFGGDRWLALPTTDGWNVIDLTDGTMKPLAVPQEPPPMDVAVSRDGEYVVIGYPDVASIRRVDEPDVELATRKVARNGAYGWEAAGTLLIQLYDSVVRLNPDGTELDRAQIPGIFLGLHRSPASWIAAWQEQYRLDEGLRVQDAFADQSTFLTSYPEGLEFPRIWKAHHRASLFNDVVALDGGRYLAGSHNFGIVHFDATGAYAPKSGNGPIRWLRTDGDSVVIGFPHGPRRIALGTGEVERLPVTPMFSQFPVVQRGETLVARGAKVVEEFFQEPIQMSGAIVVVDRAGATEVVETGAVRIEDVTVDERGGLHWASPAGFFVRKPGEEGPTMVRATPPRPDAEAQDDAPDGKTDESSREASFLEGMVAAGIAMQSSPAHRQFSADGSLAVMAANGKATVVRTTDYTDVVYEGPAQQCAFGSSALLACIIRVDDSNWEVAAIDLESGDELHRAPLMDLDAVIEAVTRDMGVEPPEAERKMFMDMFMELFGRFGVRSASDSGRFVAVGTANSGTMVIDLREAKSWKPEGHHVSFLGDQVVSTDGTDLFIRSRLPTDQVAELPLATEAMGR